MALTEEQKAKIEENRRKALEKIRKKSETSSNGITKPISSSKPESNGKFNLTPAQRLKIEENRAQALAKLKSKQDNFRNASSNKNPFLSTATSASGIRPTIRASTYIDYDMSKMKDNKGGFITQDPYGNEGLGESDKTFDQWQSEQRIIRDLPPPIDTTNSPKCVECQSLEIDLQYQEVFKCIVCRRCIKKFPEKYTLLTKTECKEDYYLTDPELQDLNLFPRIEKANPYAGTFSRMQLFLRCKIEEFAMKKWGSLDALDQEWERREKGKLRRREQKYEKELRDMRRRTRAEEFSRRLREGNNGEDHKHQFSAQALDAGTNEDGLRQVKRRCVSCGFEIVELML